MGGLGRAVAWPSGLRRWFKAPVSSEAWVRIPPLPWSLFTSKDFHSFEKLINYDATHQHQTLLTASVFLKNSEELTEKAFLSEKDSKYEEKACVRGSQHVGGHANVQLSFAFFTRYIREPKTKKYFDNSYIEKKRYCRPIWDLNP